MWKQATNYFKIANTPELQIFIEEPLHIRCISWMILILWLKDICCQHKWFLKVTLLTQVRQIKRFKIVVRTFSAVVQDFYLQNEIYFVILVKLLRVL